ncbi:porin [Vibrio cholerae]|uniref:porin n=1 Tax=Vibrio cholerae TaxID=666 RepID=UPI000F0BCA87|nr:porin [Vibrio cholerae]MEB5519980.1 porin [Vibrio cholerae]MEB5528647.1 porin [Vibrio cholerae]RNE60762.1 porin [Vibrio cholerae]GHY83644.1 Outer membrane protein OmpT [Vibrio cholerae]
MKKTLLALAVLAAASSVNAVEILKSDAGTVDFYGQLRQEFKKLDGKDATLSSGSSRAGFDAKYAISEGVNLLGKAEVSLSESANTLAKLDDEGEAVKSNSGNMYMRLHFVGVSTDFGTLNFGKQIQISDDVWGAENSYFFGGDSVLYANDGVHDSLIKYELTQDAFWLKASYGLDEGDKEERQSELFAGTSFGDLSLYAGIGNAELNTKKQNYHMLTAAYVLGNLDFGVTYYYNKTEETGKADVKKDSFVIAGGYKVAEKTKLYGGYELIETKHAKSDVDNVYGGVEYKFASWGRVYAEANYNKEEGKSSTDNYGIGARVYW